MVTPQSAPAAGQEPVQSADLLDPALLRDYLGFCRGSLRRHKLLAATVFTVVVAGTAGALAVLPRTYHVESKLLAQRNQVIATLGNPGRNLPWEADMPLRAATETVVSHDNLMSIAKQTDLVNRWAQTRAPLPRLKDELIRAIRGPEPADERLASMVGLLKTRLKVTIGEGTVTMSIDWPDSYMAYRLVETAQQNFLEARHVSEISAISEAISILEARAFRLLEQIDESVAQIEKSLEGKPRGPNESRRQVVRRETRSRGPDRQLAQLRAVLDGKRRAIRDVEEFRKTRLAELQAKLAEQRAVYSDMHPAVLDLKQRIETFESAESSQMSALRQEEKEIQAQYLQMGGTLADQARPVLGPLSSEVARVEREAQDSEDPVLENARGELRFAMAKYGALLDRIDAATMELDTSRAAFKYRYSVVVPAEIPRGPVTSVARIVIGGILGALFVAFFAAIAADLHAGRVLERWQVERQLRLPVLAEMRVP